MRYAKILISWLCLLLALYAAVAQAATPNTWTGSGPFATGLGNRVINALAVSSDGYTVFSGTGSGTVFRYDIVNPPSARTDPASGISASGAVLNGTVNDKGATTAVSFDYGTTTAYGSTVAATTGASVTTGSGDTASAVTLSGLDCNTTYHFRVSAINAGGTANGDDASFKTGACVPTATTGSASSIGATGASLGATIADNGASTAVSFEYGLTTAYGHSLAATPASVANGAGSTAVSATLSSLTCNTIYHFRVSGVNSAGTSHGSDVSFTTGACLPTAITGTASNIAATGATLGGTVADNGATTTVSFDYGLSTSYGSTAGATPASIAAGAGSTAAVATITGLTCNTTYHFRITGANSAGTGNGSSGSFTTVACPPTVTSLSPATGPSLGGTTVVITGTNLSAATAVKFGNANAIGFTVNSATQITATTPAGAMGFVDVTVTTAGGTSAINTGDQFTYDGKTYTGPLPGGGMATAHFTGGGVSCGFTTAQFVDASSVSAPPAGYRFNQGLFAFHLSACTLGQTITMTITYPSTPGTMYWKYGPTAANHSNHWYQLTGVNFSGNTVSFSLTDGGLGDDDLAADGNIIDAGGPGSLVSSSGSSIPTLSEWALILLAMLVLGSGIATMSGRFYEDVTLDSER